VLIEELNCVACHGADGTLAARSKKAPRLAEIGARVHPAFIENFIRDPHKTKPGTTMPDVLARLSPAEKERTATELTHFLLSLKSPAFAPQTADHVAAAEGHRLFHSRGCAACHAPRDEQAEELPTDEGWQYEPKWDGFRCLAFRDGDEVDLRSKAGKPLGRYFPDVVDALRSLGAKRFVLDGEIVVPVGGTLSFEELQLRLHPAASRVQKLAAAHPALVVGFDLLLGPRGGPLTDRPLFTEQETGGALKAADFASYVHPRFMRA
jgi:ATP-dependent DNA ligase